MPAAESSQGGDLRSPTPIARRSLIELATVAAIVPGLTACGTASAPPGRVRFPEPSYEGHGPLRLEVSTIEIDTAYRPSLAPPHVDHLMPLQPEQALRRWAADRLVATGTVGRRARFMIEDAKVVESVLPRSGGLRELFTADQARRYDGTVSASLEIRPERGASREGFASATVTRFRTTAQGISINERERVWFELVDSMLADFNAEFERQVRDHLIAFLR